METSKCLTLPVSLARRNQSVYTRCTLSQVPSPGPPMLAPLIRLLTFLTPGPHLFPIFRRGRFQTGLFRSNPRPLLLPLPLGEGWGEGLPGNHPGVTQRSLLAPRRRSRLFPIFRRGRFQTGLFRSRRPHPTPAPRPRTQPLPRRPAAPHSPNLPRQPAKKIRPKLSLASRPPLGAGWREIAPPSPHPIPAARHPSAASSDLRDRRLRCRGAPPATQGHPRPESRASCG